MINQKDWRPSVFVSVCGAAAAFLAGCASEKNSEQYAREYRDCLMNADAPCVRRMMDPVFWDDNKMSDQDIQNFLKDWVRPKYSGTLIGSESVWGDGSNGSQMFTWSYQTTGGKKTLTVIVGMTDHGMKVVQGFDGLIYNAASYDEHGVLQSGIQKLRMWDVNLRKFEPELRRYNLTKMRPGLGNTAMTLTQAANSARSSYERLKAESNALRSKPK